MVAQSAANCRNSTVRAVSCPVDHARNQPGHRPRHRIGPWNGRIHLCSAQTRRRSPRSDTDRIQSGFCEYVTQTLSAFNCHSGRRDTTRRARPLPPGSCKNIVSGLGLLAMDKVQVEAVLRGASTISRSSVHSISSPTPCVVPSIQNCSLHSDSKRKRLAARSAISHRRRCTSSKDKELTSDRGSKKINRA